MPEKDNLILLGSYPQRSAAISEKEPIAWMIVDRQGDRVFCVSKYLLDCKPYHDAPEKVTWQNCALRKWLNEDFLLAAFTAGERKRILMADVKNPAQDTQDRIFLLSCDEVEHYLKLKDRAAKTTAYTRAQGAWFLNESEAERDLDEINNGSWWLRYYGNEKQKKEGSYDFISCVNFDGYIERAAEGVDEKDCSVRPAMWITANAE